MIYTTLQRYLEHTCSSRCIMSCGIYCSKAVSGSSWSICDGSCRDFYADDVLVIVLASLRTVYVPTCDLRKKFSPRALKLRPNLKAVLAPHAHVGGIRENQKEPHGGEFNHTSSHILPEYTHGSRRPSQDL